MVILMITGACCVYMYVAFVASMLTFRAMKDSTFWDEGFAALLTFMFLPAAAIWYLAKRTTDAMLAHDLPKAIVKAEGED